jgi:putative FmdB family regulatory protein
MPLYEYECITCHRRTEKIQKFSDPEITVCPYCTGHLERVLSAPAISFKGGGWFADGYGNAKPKSASDGASKGASSNGSNAGNGSSSSDSKSSTDSSSTPAPAPAAAAATPAPASSSADKK